MYERRKEKQKCVLEKKMTTIEKGGQETERKLT
jgi:hypothetical protein